MIDHLMKAADEAAMIAALPQYRTPAVEDAPASWRGDIVFPCHVFDGTSTDMPVTNEDGSTGTVAVLTPLPYFYLWIALPAKDDALAAMPECMLITDRDAADRGEPFILFTSQAQDTLASYTISPVVAGSNYPFGLI